MSTFEDETELRVKGRSDADQLVNQIRQLEVWLLFMASREALDSVIERTENVIATVKKTSTQWWSVEQYEALLEYLERMRQVRISRDEAIQSTLLPMDLDRT